MSTDFVFDGDAYTPSTPLEFNFAPAQTFSHTASGGLTIGGSAVFSTTASPEVGGDLVIGGSAVCSFSEAPVPEPVPVTRSGGGAIGYRVSPQKGPAITKVFAHTASGGKTIGGTGLAAFAAVQRQRFSHTAKGGKRVSGLARSGHLDTLATIRAHDDEALLLGILAA